MKRQQRYSIKLVAVSQRAHKLLGDVSEKAKLPMRSLASAAILAVDWPTICRSISERRIRKVKIFQKTIKLKRVKPK